MPESAMPCGIVPRGRYAKGARSPIVYVLLCPPCAGYAPITDEDYEGALSGRCQGCGTDTRERHRFQAVILSAANGGCMCDTGHPQVTGDLPTEDVAGAVMTEVRTRPQRPEMPDGTLLPPTQELVLEVLAAPGPAGRERLDVPDPPPLGAGKP